MQIEIDTLIERCNDKIAQLKDELRLEERLRQRLLEIKDNPGSVQVRTHAGNGGHRPAGTIVSGSLLSHVIEVLKTEGSPMRAREIAGRIKDHGYTTNAKGGLKIAVSTVLAHNHGRVFRKVESGVYELLKGSDGVSETKKQD